MSSARDADRAAVGRIGFVGAGALGTALARALAARGFPIVAVAAREQPHARPLATALPGTVTATTAAGVVRASDMVFLAVPDDVIESVAASLPWHAGHAAIHLSGAQSADLLASAAASGARTAALHPLMTFSRPDLATPSAALLERFAGCTWALEAADPALDATLSALVSALGGHVLRLEPSDRIPYHIAAVLASNYVVALLAGAATLWEGFGVGGDDAVRALVPLLRAAVERIAAGDLPQALSGPIARGDVGTIAAHLAWLRERAAADDPRLVALRDAYMALGRMAIPLAVAKGTLTRATADQLRALLEAG